MMTPDQVLKTYGVTSQFYGTAPAWRDMVRQLSALYQDRIAGIPWLPDGWAAFVMPAMMGNTDEFYVIAPATANYYDPVTQTTKYGADFLDTPEKKEFWNNLARMCTEIITAYAANQSAAGAILIQKAYDNVEMWNSAVKMVNLLAAPVNILTDAANVYDKYKTAISGLAIVGAVGWLIYTVTRRH